MAEKKKTEKTTTKTEKTMTKSEIQEEINKLVDAKLAQEGLLNNQKNASNGVSEEEQEKIQDILVKTFEPDTYFSDSIPLEWQGVFNMVTRMYESNEDYQYVRYNKQRNTLQIVLSNKKYNPKSEYSKIHNLINYDTLTYSLYEDEPEKFVIEIGIK